MAVFDVFAWTPLFVTDSVSLNIQILNVEDMLALSDTVISNQHVQNVEHLLHLNDQVTVNKTVALSTADGLVMSQDGQRTPIPVVVVDYLNMYQLTQTYPHWPDVKQTLVMTDVAVCVVAYGVYDTLMLTQSVQVEKSVAVQAANALTIHSKATVLIPDQFWTSYDVVVVNP